MQVQKNIYIYLNKISMVAISTYNPVFQGRLSILFYFFPGGSLVAFLSLFSLFPPLIFGIAP